MSSFSVHGGSNNVSAGPHFRKYLILWWHAMLSVYFLMQMYISDDNVCHCTIGQLQAADEPQVCQLWLQSCENGVPCIQLGLPEGYCVQRMHGLQTIALICINVAQIKDCDFSPTI